MDDKLYEQKFVSGLIRAQYQLALRQSPSSRRSTIQGDLFYKLVRSLGWPALLSGPLYKPVHSMSWASLQVDLLYDSGRSTNWANLQSGPLYELDHHVLWPIGHTTCHQLYGSSLTPIRWSLN